MFHILVVEDDRDLNRAVCTFLRQSGYEATGCQRAADAYDAMYETVFDLIISDIMMPEIDGYAFAKTVRSLNSEIPILFMTAKDDILSMQKVYRIGIDDYMTKPVPVWRDAAVHDDPHADAAGRGRDACGHVPGGRRDLRRGRRRGQQSGAETDESHRIKKRRRPEWVCASF